MRAPRRDPLVSFPDAAVRPQRMPPGTRALHPSPMCGCVERVLTGCQGSMLPLYSVRREPMTVRMVCDTCWAWNDVSRLPPSQATPRVLLAPTHGPPLLWTRRHGCPRCGGTGGRSILHRISIRMDCPCGQTYYEHMVGTDPLCPERTMRPGILTAGSVRMEPAAGRCRGYYCAACRGMASVDDWPRRTGTMAIGGPIMALSCGVHKVTGSRLALVGWSAGSDANPDPGRRPMRWPG